MLKRLGWIGFLLVMFTMLLAVGRAEAGGWAVLTLEKLPQGLVDGQPITIRYTLRQHGQHPVSGLDGSVTARHLDSGEIMNFEVESSDRAGTYQATLLLTTPGTWQWSISSPFGQHPMPNLQVAEGGTLVATADRQSARLTSGPVSEPLSFWRVFGFVALGLGSLLLLIGWQRQARLIEGLAVAVLVAGAAAAIAAPGKPAASAETQEVEISTSGQALAETAPEESDTEAYGADLFVAKGCITCHQNHRIEGVEYHVGSIGPNLTKYGNDPDFLRKWLSDPGQVRLNTLMPNLNLSPAEIEALIIFLNAD